MSPQRVEYRWAFQGLCIPGLTVIAVAYLGDLVEPAALGKSVGGWIAANVAGGLITDGWLGVAASCLSALGLALLSDWLLCGE